jgi:hypothetical protein
VAPWKSSRMAPWYMECARAGSENPAEHTSRAVESKDLNIVLKQRVHYLERAGEEIDTLRIVMAGAKLKKTTP